MVVENNDSIYVPPQPVTVGVFGAVPSPASFEYVRGGTMGAYLRQAGGFPKIADKSKIFEYEVKNGALIGPAPVRFNNPDTSEAAINRQVFDPSVVAGFDTTSPGNYKRGYWTKLDPTLVNSKACRPRRAAKSLQTKIPRTLLPLASSGGEKMPMPNWPGMTPTMPPPTPLLEGMPTR